MACVSPPPLIPQAELDLEKGLEMRRWVLSGILASEETYLSHLEALLLVNGAMNLAILLVGLWSFKPPWL